MNTFALDPHGTRDLGPEVIDENGLPCVLPASFYKGTTAQERALLGHRHALYLLPTVELSRWLTKYVDGRSAIEIGAGNGRLAQHMGIPATDSLMQVNPAVRAYYALLGQPCITYGPNVFPLEASEAVEKYKPQVIIGAWITHRFDPGHPEREGNEFGPDIDRVLAQVEELILIGNEQVHAKNPLWGRPHFIHYLPFVYSRAVNGSRDFVAIWKGNRS